MSLVGRTEAHLQITVRTLTLTCTEMLCGNKKLMLLRPLIDALNTEFTAPLFEFINLCMNDA